MFNVESNLSYQIIAIRDHPVNKGHSMTAQVVNN